MLLLLRGLGLQLLGQVPDLKKLLKPSLVMGLFSLAVRYIPIDWVSQITLLFILLIVGLIRSRQAGLQVAAAAVILGFLRLLI